MTQSDIDTITTIFRSALDHIAELNSYEFIGGVGVVTMLVMLAFVGIVVPYILRLLGYTCDDD